ncbi:AAA family ATPase [Aquimarina sp. TRL1]|uniref:DEAD/DEAH box helicase n=1 Tax=Aquimarina sp. (strain TRL1) TaxID=2736252 RepID=UPI00158F15C5|nr:AAA domain-containing protein [Aquimarina sp. TRL1]QKX07487.1 AAA family ATPase [Aquimarina sp. TRL1]
MDIQKLIKYFSDCYKADNREFSIVNFFSAKYENHWIQEAEEELINGKYPRQYIPEEQGEEISKNLQLYKRDKQLYYCTMFIVGRKKLFNKKTVRVCAPLFYYPATIIREGETYYVSLEIAEREVNYGFLKTLEMSLPFEDFRAHFTQLLEENLVEYSFLMKVKRLFERYVEGLHFSDDITLFPKLRKGKELRKVYNDKEVEFGVFRLVSASGLMVSSKANNMQGVVNELERLCEEVSYSTAVEAYFGQEKYLGDAIYKPGVQPFILNHAQQQIVKSAYELKKSVFIGPPGTGKSYTVAAIAIDYLSKGKSVLVAARTEEALQVVSDKLASFSVGRFRMKVGGSRYKISLIASLERYLYKFNTLPYIREIDKDHTGLEFVYEELKRIEKAFETVEEKSRKLTQTILRKPGVVRTVKMKWVTLFKTWQQEEWRLLDLYVKYLNKGIQDTNKKMMGQVLGKIRASVRENRKELQRLVSMLRNTDKSTKLSELELFDFKVVLDALPVWLVKIDEVSEVFPLQKELFDVLVIDEATQCDIAGVLPLLQRAKKVVVTGDPKQLRHMCFLSKQQMKLLSVKNELPWEEKYNYRERSLLDFVLEGTSKVEQVNLLDEHYRSLPDIIGFSNQKFYDDALTIMHDLPKNKGRQSVFMHRVQGKRNTKGVNEKEAEEIVLYIQEVIRKEEKLSKTAATSIGVITPFKDQITYIGKLVKKEISLQAMNKHAIRLGTPYSFQGDERDIMLISMTVDNDSHHSSYSYLNKEDMFNVMVTRARNKQKIYLSVDENSLSEHSLLRTYLDWFVGVEKLGEEETGNKYFDDFATQVQAFVMQENPDSQCFIGYELSGLVIDVLIEKNNKYLGIDLIGFPGDFEKTFSMERCRVLHRVGIEVVPLSYVTWYFDEQIKNELSIKIENL